MKLDFEQWRALSELLDQALDLDQASFEGWIERLTGADAAMKPVLLDLLAHRSRQETADFLGTLPHFAGELPDAVFAAGALVGPYRLLRELGRGGMGEVWLAERADGLVNRSVALKLPLVALARTALVERFARERELLAPLAHANIARLYDAGFAGDGQPYLALEFVDGVPITRYADTRRLDIARRIALFRQVLDAVAHAHANLVLHRDLKPSNILVTPQGEVKLLDFGIAKLLAEGRSTETALTRMAGRALTIDYASPEQIAGAPLTTTSDVYSLGVVLYELLTGARPYRLKRGSRGEMEEAIAWIDPTPPSRATLPEGAGAARSLTLRKLRRALAGDIDTIVLKALKKQASERYPGVLALADDLDRYRCGAPVLARPDSIRYRATRFIGRHRTGVGAAAIIATVLSIATIVAFEQAHVATAEARRADASRNFIATLFQGVARNNPGGAAAGDTTVRQLLDVGSRQVQDEPRSDAGIQLELLGLLSRLNLDLDLLDTSAKLADRAIVLARDLHGDHGVALAQALTQKADVLYRGAHYTDAIDVAQQALAIAEPARNGSDELLAKAHIIIGNSQYQLDTTQSAEAQRHLEAALALLTRAHSVSEDRSRAAYYLAWIAQAKGDFAHAQAHYVDGIAAGRANFGERSFIVASGYESLADMLRIQQRLPEAHDAIAKAISIYAFVLGAHHGTVAFAKTNLAMIEAASGERALAERTADEALALAQQVFGNNARQTGFPAVQAARIKADRGEVEAAAASYAQAIAVFASNEPPSSRTNRMLPIEYAEVLIAIGQNDRARAALEQSKTASDAVREAPNARSPMLTLARAELDIALGHRDDAVARLQEVAIEAAALERPNLPLLARVAEAIARTGPSRREADALLALLPKSDLPGPTGHARSLDVETQARLDFAMGRFHLVAGHTDEAIASLRRAVSAREALDAADSPWLAEAQIALAEALAAAGQPTDARVLLARADAIDAAHPPLHATLRQPLQHAHALLPDAH